MNEQQTILLVDDSESDIFLLCKAFSKAEFNPSVQEVHNGEEAIAYLAGEGAYTDRAKFPLPTIMLLDLNMPMKNGFAVLAWLRTQPGLKRLTVVIMTASMRKEDLERAFDLGANSFLVKPSGMEKLVAMVRFIRDWSEFNQFPPLSQEARK
ncbi:MAG: response regulator [Blastocatellia bacterium]|nr:response regulator [Blastocatellia bacterium]